MLFHSTPFMGAVGRLAAFFLLFNAAFPQSSVPAGAVLQEIRVIGLQRLDEAAVIQATGLKVKQAASSEQLSKAASRLAETGVFSTVSYSYEFDDRALSVEFKVEENPKRLQCLFDNFVWLTDEELIQRLRQAVPLFDGSAPESGTMLDDIVAGLEHILKSLNITAHVERTISGDLSTGRLTEAAHLFKIVDFDLPITEVRLEGNAALDSGILQEKTAALLNTPYSKTFAERFVKNNVIPVYLERGYWTAEINRFGVALPAGPSDGRQNVAVVIGIREGSVFRWAGTEWKNNLLFPAAVLDSLMNLKIGEIANVVKIEQGREAIKQEYGKKGYIRAALEATPHLDEKAFTLSYTATVIEGPIFRMGNLSIEGLHEPHLDRYRKAWRLAPGEVFNASYPSEYVRNLPPADPKAAFRSLKTSLRINSGANTVDVSIEFVR